VPLTISYTDNVIHVPQSYLTPISAGLYELDVDGFRLDLKDLEDDPEGMAHPDTHRHNTTVEVGGVTLARTVEILAPYTVEFEDVGVPYTVRCVGANHNISDVKVVNQVSLIIGNSAGLIVSETGTSGLTPEESQALLDIDSNVTLVQGDVTTIQGDVSAIEGGIAVIQGDVADLDSNVAAISGSVLAIEGDIALIQTDVGTVQIDLATLEAILRNRRQIDPATGIETVFEPDSVTPKFTRNVYEDKDATQPYRGRGVERAGRFT